MANAGQENNKTEAFLYALSTCARCARVKKLLEDLEVEFSFVDVDLLSTEKKQNAKNEMRKWDPRIPFPMLIINKNNCVIGDEPDLIKKALNK